MRSRCFRILSFLKVQRCYCMSYFNASDGATDLSYCNHTYCCTYNKKVPYADGTVPESCVWYSTYKLRIGPDLEEVLEMTPQNISLTRPDGHRLVSVARLLRYRKVPI